LPWVADADEALVMAGAWSTVRVNDWVTEPNVFAAVKVTLYTPPWSSPGVPANVAVPLPLSVKVIPDGNAPVSLIAGVGDPLVLTVKLKADPSVAVAVAAEVMVEPAWTVNTKD
jgi:hypothetical protein